MPYLIDGHNLIPKVPGLELQDIDDENQLIELLIQFCRRQGKQVEVFFDNAPPGGIRARNYGSVTARFVRQGTTADQAIRGRLRRLGRAARNWTVVSSDLEVQVEARAARAHWLSSETFSDLMSKTLLETRRDERVSGEQLLDPQEIEDWMKLFNSKDRGK